MSRTTRMGVRAAVVASLGFGAVPLCAQMTFEIAPFIGYFRPTANFSKAQETATWLPQTPRDLSGVVVGIDARLWFHNEVALQLQAGVAYSTTHFEVLTLGSTGSQPPLDPNRSLGAQVQFATVQVITNMAPTSASYRVWASAGPAVVHRGGDAYSLDTSIRSSFDPGAALGLGGDIQIGHRMHATVAVNSLMYWVHVDNVDDHHSIERGFQNDLLLHAGLAWTVR